jgi:Heparinase II/III-like protein
VPALGRHLAVADALTGSRATDLASAWLVPPGSPVEPALPAPAAEPRDFHAEDGGLVVLRRGGRRLTMDVGPLGYLSIAAHGHADALSVTVAVDGRDVLGDPGTGSYYAEPAVRAAFRGTRAHGTAAVDDLDQSVPGGPFLWVRHATTTVRAVDLDRGLVEAEHDGYTRLAEPVRHRRYLLAPPGAAAALVVDLFTGAGAHRLRTAWPVHPDLEVRDGDGRHVVADPATGEDVLTVAAASTAPAEPWSVRGDEGSRLGWWSHRFESRTPAWLVGTVVPTAALPVAMATVLGPDAAPPRVSLNGNDLQVWWRDGTTRYDVHIDTGVMGAVSLRRAAPEEEKV